MLFVILHCQMEVDWILEGQCEKKVIIKGNVSYEDLVFGDKVIIDTNLLYWYSGLDVGDTIEVVVEDGNGTHERLLEIAAIGLPIMDVCLWHRKAWRSLANII